MTQGNDLFDIIHTTRAMRRLKPDPVPDELVRRILEAGTCAPSGGANQRWRFLVVKDRSIKEQVQKWDQKAFDEMVGPRYRSSAPPPGSSPGRYRRQHDAVEYLTEHYHEAPVWIVVCQEHGETPPTRSSGASVYPAVQNMLLAARALGLGATLTTRHLRFEEEVETILGLPEGIHSYAILPIGFPMGNFGPVRRGSLSDVVFLDRWAQANLKRYRASVLKDTCEGRLVLTGAELARSEGRDFQSAAILLERILAERRAHWESQEKRRGKYKEPSAPEPPTCRKCRRGGRGQRWNSSLPAANTEHP